MNGVIKMKKYISSLTAIILSVSMLGISVASQTVIEPDYPINGNKCGTVIVESDIDRDVYVTIVQNSPDGKYKYYDDIIEADAKDKSFKFVIEGKDDVDYTITIGVPKFKGTSNYKEFKENIVVYDIDEIINQKVSGYKYTYIVEKNNNDEITSIKSKENIKNNENIIESYTELLFPISNYFLGDLNNDGTVNIRDAAALARSLVSGLNIPDHGDFNNDGKINIRDAAAIAKYLVTLK